MSAHNETENGGNLPRIFYRPAEVQEALGIKSGFFWKLVKEGKLDVRKLGRATVVTAESLRQFAAGLPKSVK